MHILTLTPFYPTCEDDASGCFIAESVGALDREGVRSSVIAVAPVHRRHPDLDSKAPPASLLRYVSLPGNPGLSSAGRFLFAKLKGYLRQIHHQQPISLIHAHGALPCGHAAMLLSRDLGVPFVVTVHGLDAFSTRQVSGWFGRRCDERSHQVYADAARVICISEKVALPIREKLREAAKIEVVYNGVDEKVFSPAVHSSPLGPVILSVGNLIPVKGHDVMLRALASIVRAEPKLQCRIIGDGPERARLQTLVRTLGLGDSVHFLGRRPRLEVAQAMRECALFVLPSWYEGLGCVYLEAMAAERPVIACRGQGIEEIIRHRENGWLVTPQNAQELADGMQSLLSDSALRERMGRCGRQTVLNNLTLHHQAEHLFSIYRACAA
jgi:glycosyltransferase involved in cell wall biosynthesis